MSDATMSFQEKVPTAEIQALLAMREFQTIEDLMAIPVGTKIYRTMEFLSIPQLEPKDAGCIQAIHVGMDAAFVVQRISSIDGSLVEDKQYLADMQNAYGKAIFTDLDLAKAYSARAVEIFHSDNDWQAEAASRKFMFVTSHFYDDRSAESNLLPETAKLISMREFADASEVLDLPPGTELFETTVNCGIPSGSVSHIGKICGQGIDDEERRYIVLLDKGIFSESMRRYIEDFQNAYGKAVFTTEAAAQAYVNQANIAFKEDLVWFYSAHEANEAANRMDDMLDDMMYDMRFENHLDEDDQLDISQVMDMGCDDLGYKL